MGKISCCAFKLNGTYEHIIENRVYEMIFKAALLWPSLGYLNPDPGIVQVLPVQTWPP